MNAAGRAPPRGRRLWAPGWPVLVGLLVAPAWAGPPAGVIPYTCVGRNAYVLLAHDGFRGRDAWGTFGGTARAGEGPAETASREFHEETGCVFPTPTAAELRQARSSRTDGFEAYVWRVPYVAPAVIAAAACGDKDLRSQWVWVALDELLQALPAAAAVADPHRPGRRYPLWINARRSMAAAAAEGLLPAPESACADAPR